MAGFFGSKIAKVEQKKDLLIFMKNLTQKKYWKILKSEIVFESRWIKIIKDLVELPSGVIIDDYLTTELNNVVMIFAITKNNQVIFVKQYRHGSKKVMLELPAGICEDDESMENKAREELLEETGYTANKVVSLGKIIDYPTKDSHHINLFLFKNAVYKSSPQPEATEDIEVVLIPLRKILKKVKDGDISVSATIGCVLKSLLYLNYINLT